MEECCAIRKNHSGTGISCFVNTSFPSVRREMGLCGTEDQLGHGCYTTDIISLSC